MAVGTFAPCVLYPVWQSYHDLQLASRLEARRVDAMQSRLDHERRLLHALRNDPHVVARLARRDLGIQSSNDRSIRVGVTKQSSMPEHAFNPRPDFASVITEETGTDRSGTQLAAVFRNPKSRRLLMVMSVALMGVALWIPSHRPT